MQKYCPIEICLFKKNALKQEKSMLAEKSLVSLLLFALFSNNFKIIFIALKQSESATKARILGFIEKYSEKQDFFDSV